MAMKHAPEKSDPMAVEKSLVGRPGDLVDEEFVPSRPRSSTVMFSTRIDRRTFEALSDLAETRGRTFSETVRHALRSFVARPTDDHLDRLPRAGTAEVGQSAADIAAANEEAVEVGPVTARKAWTDEDLDQALKKYELTCRDAHMRDNASRSYIDYARRFLAWRKGDYRPRGTAGSGRPVPVRSATTPVLLEQAASYGRRAGGGPTATNC